jgi:hypothetical protein
MQPAGGPQWPRLRPIDAFFVLNLLLFLAMCVVTYYARFVAYRGAANIWEFFVYAAVLVTGIGLLWRSFRDYGWTVPMLGMIQAGILAHFAGAFVQWDGHRLYDVVWWGIRYDKLVHATNAFIAVRVTAHIAIRHGLKIDGLARLLVALSVLGLGAVVEIVEYVVMHTVPGNGVGGYDNNMQDLAANLVGTVLSIGGLALARDRRLQMVGPPRRPRLSPQTESLVSTAEIGLLVLAALCAVWVLPAVLPRTGFAILDVMLIGTGLAYTVWLSPTRVHGDRLAARGLGDASTWFVRIDNLRPALRAFAALGLVGVVLLLLVADWRNPGWLARADWRAWTLRLVFYVLSAGLQSLVFIGFLLPRLRRAIFGRSLSDEPLTHAAHRALVAIAAAAIFAVLHAPGGLLMALSAAFGFATAWIALRYPNVLAATLCHTLLGLLVHRAVELPLRIGYFYTHPDFYVFREAFPWIREMMKGVY